MVVSRVGLSTCYEIDMNQLELLQENGSINYFEINNDKNMLTLYWNSLAANGSEDESGNLNMHDIREVTLNLVKKFAGELPITKPRPSSAYLYYGSE